MGIRSSLAAGVGRFSAWGLRRVLGRAGSQLPGRIALALDPGLLGTLAGKLRQGAIVVCGTNGKTTTTNVLAAAIEASGRSVLCNRAGANMAPGVTGALLPGAGADWAVMEVDELSTINVVPQLKPRYFVLLNLFRDQLDRAGEIDRVQDVIASALLASPKTTVVACGDDPLCMGVVHRLREAGGQNPVVSFGIDEALDLPADRVPEARFCQVCGAELEYVYRHYAQLGSFACPQCHFERPALTWRATQVQVGREGVSFAVTGQGLTEPAQVSASFGGVYMVYNLLAAFVGAWLAGVRPGTFQRALASYKPENGRLQHLVVQGRPVVLNLAKNPTGFNQNISLMQAQVGPKAVFFVVNDNHNDGKDISWIWDVDFERLNDDPQLTVLVGGHRANDLQVRMKYAGLQAPLAASAADALRQVAALPLATPLYVLTNYSALWPAKAELERLAQAEPSAQAPSPAGEKNGAPAGEKRRPATGEKNPAFRHDQPPAPRQDDAATAGHDQPAAPRQDDAATAGHDQPPAQDDAATAGEDVHE